MQELVIWRTYHDDSLIEKYQLKEDSVLRLFKGNAEIDGKNINHLNQFYSEMTTMYWVWQNHVRSEKIGFCHYRRVFQHIIDVEKGTCQVMHITEPQETLFQQYKNAHNYQDYYDIVEILDAIYGKNNLYSRYLMNGRLFIPYCSFIMRYEDFENLSQFLFRILFEFDSMHNLDFKAENYQRKAEQDFRLDDVSYQRRTMSFLAERLISCYIVCHMSPVCVSTPKSFFLTM